MIGAEGEPCSNDATKIPGRVVDSGKDRSMLRVCELGDQERGGGVSNGHTKAQEEAGRHKHAEVDADGLKDHAEHHNQASDNDTCPSAPEIRNIADYRDGAQRTDGHDAVEKTEKGAVRVVEIALPCGQGLETVHHRSIVAVCC